MKNLATASLERLDPTTTTYRVIHVHRLIQGNHEKRIKNRTLLKDKAR